MSLSKSRPHPPGAGGATTAAASPAPSLLSTTANSLAAPAPVSSASTRPRRASSNQQSTLSSSLSSTSELRPSRRTSGSNQGGSGNGAAAGARQARPRSTSRSGQTGKGKRTSVSGSSKFEALFGKSPSSASVLGPNGSGNGSPNGQGLYTGTSPGSVGSHASSSFGGNRKTSAGHPAPSSSSSSYGSQRTTRQAHANAQTALELESTEADGEAGAGAGAGADAEDRLNVYEEDDIDLDDGAYTLSRKNGKHALMVDDGAFDALGSSNGKQQPGNKGKKAELLRCERCHKVYHHPQSLIKHRWQHTEIWNSASAFGLSKHQTVQALEAAVILSSPDPGTRLPSDKSHWPAAVSSANSGLLGSERVNIDVLSEGAAAMMSLANANGGKSTAAGKYSRSMPVRHSRLDQAFEDDEEDGEEDVAAGIESDSVMGRDEEDTSTQAEAEAEDDETSSEDDLAQGLHAHFESGRSGGDDESEIERMDKEMFSMDLNPHPHTAHTSDTRRSPYPISNLTYTRSGNRNGFLPASGNPTFASNLQSIPSATTISLPHSHSRSREAGSRHGSQGFSKDDDAESEEDALEISKERKRREASVNSNASSSNNTTSLSTGTGEEDRRGTSASESETKDSGYTSGRSLLATSIGQDAGPAAVGARPAAMQRGFTAPGGHVSMSAPVLGFFTEESPSSAGRAIRGSTGLSGSPAQNLSRPAPYHSPSLRPQALSNGPIPGGVSVGSPGSATRFHYSRPGNGPLTSPRLPSSLLLRSPPPRTIGLDSSTMTPQDQPVAHSLSRSPYSFGQAPLAPLHSSSYRASSLSRSFGQALAVPSVTEEQQPANHVHNALRSTPEDDEEDKAGLKEQEEELMDMDL